MTDIQKLADYFIALKTYFPEYVVNQFELQDICDDNDLKRKECKQFGDVLGEDFFTKETMPAVPEVDHRVTKELEHSIKEAIYTRGDISNKRNISCRKSIEFLITKLTEQETALFGGYFYARAREVTTCDVTYRHPVTNFEMGTCQSVDFQPSKGLVQFDPLTEETPKYMNLEPGPIHKGEDCPKISPDSSRFGPI